MALETEKPIASPTGGLTGSREAPASPFLEHDRPGAKQEAEPPSRKEIAAEVGGLLGQVGQLLKLLVAPRGAAAEPEPSAPAPEGVDHATSTERADERERVPA